MTILIDPQDVGSDQSVCANSKCRDLFTPDRRNQRYCRPRCQKNATRGSQAADVHHGQRYTNRREWALLKWLNERYYGTRPDERLGLLQGWLDDAREGNTALRRVLSRPEFFTPARDSYAAYFRRCWAYPPVPMAADFFCIGLRDCRVWEWVNGTAPEPETGEVITNPPLGYVVA